MTKLKNKSLDEFDYKLYTTHNWNQLEIDSNEPTQIYSKIHCNKCNTKIITIIDNEKLFIDIELDNELGCQYSNCNNSLNELRLFFEKYTCEDLIIKNILE